MTKDQLETMILANLALQFDQLVALYTAINADNFPAVDAARAARVKLQDLFNVLKEGLDNLRQQETLAAEYATD